MVMIVGVIGLVLLFAAAGELGKRSQSRNSKAPGSVAKTRQVLDDSEVTLSAGDVVVQRGTDHAWANRGTVMAKVVFILVDGEFDPSLLETLPVGAVEGLMHGGPKD